ncbi:NAD(P)-binding protein [Venturia nashicola]|uniref:NAD(P)-binding protein n=1 Tax=Venturia nashicola TaxID=86259 RepID=A0A4Z1NH61_9PEZI|nr:NAD(P)-binding protein [Venturia nashicola]TLD21043.1 NAD(P)-binding protein [Venturia nashicola]
MPLTILSDEDVRILLHSLTRKDVLEIQQALADALHYYSTATDDEDNGCSAGYQPKRIHLKRQDGNTTLFMPASSNEGMGVKIVTLSDLCATTIRPPPPTISSPESVSPGASISSGTKSGSASSNSMKDALNLSPSNANSSPGSARSSLDVSGMSIEEPYTYKPHKPSRHTSTTPFDVPPDITPEMREMKGASTSPTGSLTLLNNDGTVRGLINAAEITAFRTALASTMLFKKRSNVHDITIFGGGKQAYWHARLSLLLRGSEIHHLNFLNRSFENVVSLLHDLYKIHWPVEIHHPNTTIITPMHTEYQRHLKSTIRASSVIFCTTPSTEPLFPPEYLTSSEGRKKGRYIAAIGSYAPHMIELHTDIIKQAVAPNHKHHHHKHAKQGGAIVVDSVDACLKEAGELIQAGLVGREVVELGELVMLKREAERRRKESHSSLDDDGVELKLGGGKKNGKEPADDDGLREWLEKGNVIYKSVGLGLMDVVVGAELVRLADAMGIGTRVANF